MQEPGGYPLRVQHAGVPAREFSWFCIRLSLVNPPCSVAYLLLNLIINTKCRRRIFQNDVSSVLLSGLKYGIVDTQMEWFWEREVIFGNAKNTIVQWNKDSLLLRVSQLLRWEVVCKILRQVVQKIYKESQQLKIVGPCCCLDTKASFPLLFVDQREIREAPLCSSR